MSLKFTFSPIPDLLPGERSLSITKVVLALSCKSFPTYRWFFSLPPCCEAGLVITDRRVLLVTYVFRLCLQQFSQWYPGKEAPGDSELVKSVSTGRSRLLGPYLEVVSENARKRWYRSRELRLRLFMRGPERVREILLEAISAGPPLGH